MICPICEGQLSSPLVRDLCVCSGCGHRRRAEIPTADELKERTKHFQLSATRRKRTRQDRLANARHQLELLDCLPGRVYDVGAAAGFFLKAAKVVGWEVYGNEISVSAIEWAKQRYAIAIDYGLLEELKYEECSFDAVVIWNTLEHCLDPLTTLRACHRMLKPAGILLVSVPTKRSKELERTYAGAHLSEFTRDSLELCAHKAGFRLDWARNRQSKLCRQTDARWIRC